MLRSVHLRAPIFLLPGAKLQERILKQKPERPALPDGLAQILADLAARPDGVPATLTEWRGSPTGLGLQLHTYAYVVKLAVTNRLDGYRVNWVGPLLLRDHDRLARGCLLVRAVWRPVFDLREIPPGANAGWHELAHAWGRLQTDLGDSVGVPALKPEHTRFLDILDRLNTAERQVKAKNSETAPTFPYRSIDTVGERRDSAAGRYLFHIVGGRTPERNVYVQVRGRTDPRGQVTRVVDGQVTVRFDQDVDWESLPQQGELVLSTTDVTYAKRREAIELLRSRQTRNPSLLDVLVDHRVQPIEPMAVSPGEELDPDQLAAFRKALGVRDLLVVLGPPGTGKTRTISQIARSHALGAGRGSTLITSHTNRAVDNVLAKLPRDVAVVRVGNEGRVDPDVRPLLLEWQAADLREGVIRAAGAALERYAGVSHAVHWHTELSRRIGRLDETLAVEQRCHAEWADLRRTAGGPAQEHVDGLASHVAKLDRKAARVRARVERLERKARTRRSLPDVFGRFRLRRLTRAKAAMAGLDDAARSARAALRDAEAALDLATRDIPVVRMARGRLDETSAAAARCRSEALEALSAIRDALRPLLAVPPVEDTSAGPTTRDAVAELHTALESQLGRLSSRARVLAEWRQDVSGEMAQLYPELIRYADVVGATCIGAASRSEIADEEFDLAIVDEAGQIATTDVLVPLVRASRAVLVGDHQQLPPIVEREVLARLGAEHDPVVRKLLERSALENLVGGLPGSHVDMLTQQRRMPKVIADFVSDAFYSGRLRTMVTRSHDDALFASPLAFVDTSDLPETKRRERRSGPAGNGRENPAEAHLLARLADHYQRRGQEWALIVPYVAQQQLIVSLLLRYLPDQDIVTANVGTVDSFQGGERDVILYGFTRSNPAAAVGFLDELRRANVAFTRAKQQLVLVGDLETLLRAKDDGFRHLMGRLRGHVLSDGDLRRSTQIWRRLQEPAS